MLEGDVYICIYLGVPRNRNGSLFFTASEVAKMAGVHRLTLLRWIREGKLVDVQRDRNGWRLFSTDVAQQIVDYAHGQETRSSPNQGVLFPRQRGRIIATFPKSVQEER